MWPASPSQPCSSLACRSVHTFSGDPSGVNHCPLIVGMQRRWRPLRWHGIFAPPPETAPSGYNNLRGVGASAYLQDDSDVSPLPVWLTPWPSRGDLIIGFGTQTCYSAEIPDPAALITYAPRASYWLFPLGSPTPPRSGPQRRSS